MALTIAQPSGGVMSSLDAGAIVSGSVNQVVCDSGALAANNNEPSTFIVEVTTFQSGTQDGHNDNMLVNVGGTAAGNPSIVSGGVTIGKVLSGPTFAITRFRVSVTNGQHVYVVIGNTAPGAASVYNATMSVTKSVNRYGDV